MCLVQDLPHILANVVNLRSQLIELLEPDFGLLDHLLSLKVLTRPQLADLRSERTVYRRNGAMLDLLVSSDDKCDEFLKALWQSGQQHIANFVTENGGHNTLQCSNLSVDCNTLLSHDS